MRRSFLSLAAGLLASFAVAMPSQAGSLTAETDVTTIQPGVSKSADVEITYSSAPDGPIVILGSTTVAVTSKSIVGDVVTINYTPIAGNQEIDFTFTTNDASISITEDHLTGITDLAPHQQAGLTAGVFVTNAVPEPTSLALLGIGMAGFFTYRRIFKRTANA